MKRFYLIITILFVGVSALWSQHANVIWNTPSRNSSESMPCGGGDIGMNIWVEDGDDYTCRGNKCTTVAD